MRLEKIQLIPACSLGTHHTVPVGPFPLIPADTAAGALSLEFLPCHSRSQEMFPQQLMNS